jgi:hypothetical protein
VRKLSRLTAFLVTIFFCSITYSQSTFINLTSSDFIKGLKKKDLLREKLVGNGFKMVSKNIIGTAASAFYESWQYESSIYVDIIFSPGKENTIKVGVLEKFAGFPERLLQTDPNKNNKYRDEPFASVNVKPINQKISYYLEYDKDNIKVNVIVWYDKPYYFFEYMDQMLQ